MSTNAFVSNLATNVAATVSNVAQTIAGAEEAVASAPKITFGMIAIIVIYLAIIAFLGYKGFRATKNSSDYMVGGRNIHPYIMALSYGATFISTSAIVGFGGFASALGMNLLWLTFLNIFVGIFLAYIVFGKRTRRMGLNLDAHTFPEFLARRYDSKFIQWFAGIIIFLFMPLYAASVLLGGARFLEGMLGIPMVASITIFSILVAAYVFFGGLKGVMYTDALQGTLMFLGLFFLLIFVYSKVGGIVEGHQALAILDEVNGSILVNAPPPFSAIWWTIFSSIVLGVGIGVLAQPQLVVRFMSVKSNRELNRAVLIGGVFIFMATGTAFVVGALSNVYFQETYGMASVAYAGGIDSVIPTVISEMLPGWFGAIFMLVILAAAMSTLSSQFHTIGTSIGRDFFETLTGKDKESGGLIVTKIGILLTLLFTILLSVLTKDAKGGIIARATAIFFGLMASSFLAPYALGLYWKKATKKGAIAGIVSGISISAVMFLLFHGKEAEVFGIVSSITNGAHTNLFSLWINDATQAAKWASVDPLVIAFPVSLILTVLVSLITKVENPRRVEKSFGGIGKK